MAVVVQVVGVLKEDPKASSLQDFLESKADNVFEYFVLSTRNASLDAVGLPSMSSEELFN